MVAIGGCSCTELEEFELRISGRYATEPGRYGDVAVAVTVAGSGYSGGGSGEGE